MLLAAETILLVTLLLAWWQGRTRVCLLAARFDAHEGNYQRLMAEADLGLLVLDHNGTVMEWNPALEKRYGCSRSEALGQPFFTRFAPADEAVALTARVAAMRNSDEVFEFSFAVPQGPEYLPCRLRWRARHFTDPRDGHRYLSLVGHDVTELEFAMAQLADSELRFRRLFESVPVAMALIDLEGRLRMVNPECARFFGFDAPEQMVALHAEELIQHPEDRTASAAALAALRAGTTAYYQVETCYVRHDGQLRWGNARMVLVEVAPGQHYYLAKISDVHERKQTEHALLESERHLAMLIGNLSGAVYRYEMPAPANGLHHDQAPQFLSGGVAALTGQERAAYLRNDEPQVLGRFIVEEDRALLQAALRAAMAGDGRFVASYRLRHPQGLRQITEHGLAWQRPDGSWTVDGHLTEVAAVPRDQAGEAALRHLLPGSGSGYLSLSPQGRVLEVDEACCELLGLPAPEQTVGRALQPLLAPGHAGELDLALARVVAEGALRGAGLSYRRHDGQCLYLQVNAQAVREGGQTVVKCLLTDVSCLRRAEQAELRYRRLFEGSSEGACLVSLQGRIEAANPALCRLLGCESGALDGRFLHEITPEAWREPDRYAQEQLTTCDGFEPYRKALCHGNGSEIPVQVQGWLLRDPQGRPQRMLCTVREAREVAPRRASAVERS